MSSQNSIRILSRRQLALASLLLLLLVGMTVMAQTGIADVTSPPPSKILQIAPPVLVAPNEPILSAAGAPACIRPPPVIIHSVIHCYTPAQMAAAYTVDHERTCRLGAAWLELCCQPRVFNRLKTVDDLS